MAHALSCCVSEQLHRRLWRFFTSAKDLTVQASSFLSSFQRCFLWPCCVTRMHIPAVPLWKTKQKTVLWLDHISTVYMRDRSLENRQGSQPAWTGAVLTSGELGKNLCPRIRADYWLEVPMSAKSNSQLEYASHISVQSGQGTCLF